MRLLVTSLVLFGALIGGYFYYRSQTSMDAVIDRFVQQSLAKMRRAPGVELTLNRGPLRNLQFTAEGSYLGDVAEGGCKSKSVAFYLESNGKEGRQREETPLNFYRSDADTWMHLASGLDLAKPLDHQTLMDCLITLEDGSTTRYRLGPPVQTKLTGAQRWRFLAMWGSELVLHWRVHQGKVQFRCRQGERVKSLKLRIESGDQSSQMSAGESIVEAPPLPSGALRVGVSMEEPAPDSAEDWQVTVTLLRVEE